ncbi:MAG: antiterminator LoaP [Lachnospiraceae bacterium]|nr:antiterminator LoaP [Lachnospiraceae bacterium]
MLYVIQVMAGKEEVTEKLLGKYLDASWYTELFVPRYASVRRYGGVWHDILKAMFPGYVFVETEVPKKIFTRIKFIPKSMHIIYAEREILSVYPEEEQFIRDLIDENYIVQMSKGFMIGDRLCITEGALEKCQGKLIKIDRHKRLATLSVNLFGRETPVEVGLEVVEKVPVETFEEWKEEEKGKKRNPDRKARELQRRRKWQDRYSEYFMQKEDFSKNRPTLSEKEGAGEIIIIKQGIFAGLEAEVVSRTEEGITANILLMGKEVRILLQPEEVGETESVSEKSEIAESSGQSDRGGDIYGRSGKEGGI